MVELSPSLLPELDSETSWLRQKAGWIATFIVTLAIAAGGYWFYIRDDSAAAPVAQQQTSTATTGQLVSSLSTTGTAAASLTTRLTFQTSAKVTALNVKLGDKVEPGQVLGTLDSGDALRKLESAKVGLSAAQLKYRDLVEPATSSELASASSAVTSAKYQLANAEENLRKATAGPDADAVTTADNGVTLAEQSLTSAQNQAQSSWISLLTAQRNYCSTDNRLVDVCYSQDLPVTQFKVDSLILEIRNPATSAVGTAAQSLISSNTSYGNAQTTVANAEKSLSTAKTKRAALNDPPTALVLQQLGASVESTGAQVLSARQKYDDLIKGPAATDIALQQVSVQSAQVAVDTAQATVDATVLKAPFAGTVTAVGIAVGDNVGTATAAFTITNTEAIRVDLSVQEADYVGLKAGLYGIATFEALAGNTYVLRITFVNPTPTTTQGVVSYQVQAEILRADQLQDPATQQGVLQALSAAGTGLRSGRTQGAAPGATGANGTVAGGRTPPAGFTPGAGGQRPPGTGQTPGAGGQAGPGAQAGAGPLLALLNAPSPTPGMNASVVIVKSIQANLLLVPTSAVKTQGQSKYVVVKKEDGTSEDRPVVTGASDATNTAIASGLTEGEVVVVSTASAAAATARTPATTNQQGGGQVGPGGAGGNNATGGVR